MATGGKSSDEKPTEGEDQISESQIEQMIKFLIEKTPYRVVTESEYASLPKHSTPKPGVKYEQDYDSPPHRPPPPTPMRKSSLSSSVRDGSDLFGGSGYYNRPRIPTFSGDQKGEITFDVWKYEVSCIIREGNFGNTVLVQAMRNALKGQARSLLLTMPKTATPQQILDKLEGVYGNVYSSEALLQKFYTEKQQPNQSVADYGMKLESILQSAIDRGHINSASKDEMLRSKFWSGLSDPLLRNASRHKYDNIKNFDELRREVRAIELDLMNSSRGDSNTQSSQSSRVQQSSISVEVQKLTEVLKKLDSFGTRMDSMESELKSLKTPDGRHNQSNFRGQYPQIRRPGRYQRGRGYYSRGGGHVSGATGVQTNVGRQGSGATENSKAQPLNT